MVYCEKTFADAEESSLFRLARCQCNRTALGYTKTFEQDCVSLLNADELQLFDAL
jgi:hypothetical protein